TSCIDIFSIGESSGAFGHRWLFRQNMRRNNIRAERASDGFSDFAEDISAALVARRQPALSSQLDISFDINRCTNCTIGLSVFQRPFIFCTVKLAQIVDACVRSAGGMSVNPSRDPHDRQKSENPKNN